VYNTTAEGENAMLMRGVGTVTKTRAVNPPSTVRAIIVADPELFAVTNPELLTVTVVDVDVHRTDVFVAFGGVIVAMSCFVEPMLRVSDVIFRDMPVTGIVTGMLITFTEALAVKLPSAVVAVIVVVPTAIPVTSPTLSHVAELAVVSEFTETQPQVLFVFVQLQ
jgi:hypothetical protein